MPRSLKLLIFGVVAASAVALVAATLLFPLTPGIALPNPGSGDAASQQELLLGVAFWILLTLVASALPVQMPQETCQAKFLRNDRCGKCFSGVPRPADG